MSSTQQSEAAAAASANQAFPIESVDTHRQMHAETEKSLHQEPRMAVRNDAIISEKEEFEQLRKQIAALAQEIRSMRQELRELSNPRDNTKTERRDAACSPLREDRTVKVLLGDFSAVLEPFKPTRGLKRYYRHLDTLHLERGQHILCYVKMAKGLRNEIIEAERRKRGSLTQSDICQLNHLVSIAFYEGLPRQIRVRMRVTKTNPVPSKLTGPSEVFDAAIKATRWLERGDLVREWDSDWSPERTSPDRASDAETDAWKRAVREALRRSSDNPRRNRRNSRVDGNSASRG